MTSASITRVLLAYLSDSDRGDVASVYEMNAITGS